MTISMHCQTPASQLQKRDTGSQGQDIDNELLGGAVVVVVVVCVANLIAPPLSEVALPKLRFPHIQFPPS